MIEIGPLSAPFGTFAFTCVPERTVNADAATPPNFTADVPPRYVPAINNSLPAIPKAGDNEVICGTSNWRALFTVPTAAAVLVSVTCPVVAADGTVAFSSVELT